MASIPNDETGNALRKFVNDGSDLSGFMEIDFFVAIPSKQKDDEVALEARESGFKYPSNCLCNTEGVTVHLPL